MESDSPKMTNIKIAHKEHDSDSLIKYIDNMLSYIFIIIFAFALGSLVMMLLTKEFESLVIEVVKAFRLELTAMFLIMVGLFLMFTVTYLMYFDYIGFIRKVKKTYHELRMKEPTFCMILQTICNNLKQKNCLECETYIHYRDIYLKEHKEE